ncbi:DUF1501 domain-containing protein [Sulfurimonas sp. MAG313]|nr:DUF1501 domain-containing protein [Sulfurimonas sp. MAG313]MDF1880403.1 DUF1501 domain-containing protein [Sulfurimonas sp. MAG313]
MLRRNFLKYISVVSASLLMPKMAFATGDVYSGPLWIFVHAAGGWDPTSFCDPKGYAEVSDGEGGLEMETNPMNKSFKTADIATSASGSNIKFAPLRETQNDIDNGRYAFRTFFDKYGKDLLVINGIDTQTNGHTSGTRYTWSGRLSEGYPAFSALLAGISLPASPMSFITSGGYDFTDGVVAGTRLGNIRAIQRISYVNRYSFDRNRNVETPFHDEATFARILAAREERYQDMYNKQSLRSIKDMMQKFKQAHSGSNELKKLIEYLPDDLNTHPNRNNRVFAQGRFAMAGYKAGLTVSVNISSGGFDTHGNHDNNHIPRLADVFQGLDLLREDAQKQGIADKVIFVVGSEFGRTPGYNGGNGKDHWAVTSMMMMGPGIVGNRVIGGSTQGHKALKVNPTTLNLDENGIRITPAHIHKALRKLANIDTKPLITQYYPISGVEDIPLF